MDSSDRLLRGEIDTYNSSFLEIVNAVSEKLNSNNLQVVRYTLPVQILMLPEKVSLESLESLKLTLNKKEIKQSGVILGELARIALVRSGESPNDLTKIKNLVVEMITSILLNLGGTRQLEGGYSQRLQDFANLVVDHLQPYREIKDNQILKQSQEYSLKQIFLEVNQLIQSLDPGDAIQQLLGTLPEHALEIALSRVNNVSPLLERWCHSVDNISNSLLNKNEEQVAISIAHSMSELLNIMAFLLSNESLTVIIESTQQWITGFFTNASGGTPVNINITRLLGVLKKAASLNRPLVNIDQDVTQRLLELGVKLDEISQEVKLPLLTTLNPETETDEMFTGRLLIENGKISPGLAIIVKTSQEHGIHVFVYDRNGIEQWIRNQTTVPETRECFRGRVIPIS